MQFTSRSSTRQRNLGAAAAIGDLRLVRPSPLACINSTHADAAPGIIPSATRRALDTAESRHGTILLPHLLDSSVQTDLRPPSARLGFTHAMAQHTAAGDASATVASAMATTAESFMMSVCCVPGWWCCGAGQFLGGATGASDVPMF